MISSLGIGLVLAGLFFAAIGSIVGFVAGARRDAWLLQVARYMAYGYGASLISACLLMMYALLIRDFSVHYVSEVGSLSVPTHIAIISLWSSLNGSILFWGGVLGVYVIGMVASLRGRHPDHEPYAIGVLLAISVFFALLVASIANPFAPTELPIPLDGPGPNALLQNHPLMAFHPPMLYLGYVGMAVPFSMCAAALLAGRLDAGWMAPIRTAMLVPWTFLTVGVVTGGWWSYEVLGWGGYWAWDPVENASFMPWLTGTAFLHSAMVMQRRGRLHNWTLALGMATFLLTLLGTFMTRSGVFNSVHSFTQSDIGPVFLGMIALTFSSSVLLLALRSHTVMPSAAPPVSKPSSRETVMLLQNLAFASFTFTVLVGVLYPLVMEGWFETRVTVGQPYFDHIAVPLGTAIVFMMGVGPVLPWGGVSEAAAGRSLLPALGAGVVATVIAAVAGIHHSMVLLALFVCAFALAANLGEYTEPVGVRMKRGEGVFTAMSNVLARGRRRFGGHVAHLGVIVATVAIAMSSAYKVEQDAVLTLNQSTTIGAWTATSLGTHEIKESNRSATVARFSLTKGGSDAGVIEPRLNFYPRMMEPIGTPAVRSSVAGDLYVSLLHVDDAAGVVSIRIMTMPLVVWLWVSPLFIILGTLMALWPERRALASASVAPAATVESV